ncbi:unnamed protein product [Peronospora belbahrii]|uniref:Uncharacterized protein n=1 Tax=Peronospora belbahrii TaxID=622444 RepID=A0AAU9L539_9STRA|nr:unnamed protein product [Peronospora belbahrii]CAH0516428.1 unnamed protein product [Peronospora belbahrii]
MEGKFYRSKTLNHPHTNMAKAAANMMTRTCAEDLMRKGIYMNSVDTAGSTTRTRVIKLLASQIPITSRRLLMETDVVLDPIFALYQDGSTDKPLFGEYLKDYTVSEW